MSKQTIRLGPVEEWDIDKLSAIADNAKLHPDWQVEQIAESMDEFTFIDPMGLDENGEILEGRGRFLAAKKRGYKTVPAFQIFGLTEAQKVAYRLAHNKLTMTTGFDPEILKLNFEFLQEEGFDLDLTGFGGLELSFLDEDEKPDDSEWGDALGDIPSGDRATLSSMSFTLTEEQVSTIKDAIDVAKGMGEFDESVNQNSNGNSLARICEMFVGSHG